MSFMFGNLGKPAPLGVEPDIPFRVRRSVYKQLPVYSDYRNGRTRVLTRISKIDGDVVVSYVVLFSYQFIFCSYFKFLRIKL